MGIGQVALVAGYLLMAPPVFLVGPLAGLIALSRPSSWREWGWLAIGVLWLVLWLRDAGDVPEQTLRALGVLVTGGFLALSLAGPSVVFRRALITTTFAFGAVVLWCLALGIGWHEIQLGIARSLSRSFEAMALETGTSAPADVVDLFRQLGDAAPQVAQLMPGVVFLQALAGLVLGWSLYQRVSRHPTGPAAAPFRGFRFSDHLVWLVIVGLALVLLSVSTDLHTLGSNMLLVGGALYAARGLAVIVASAGRLPPLTRVAIALVAVFMLPFVLGGLTLLGLADIWLDFRRRLSPATGGFDR